VQLDPDITAAVIRIAIAGGIGGLIGGMFATRRASLIGSILMGVIGSIAVAAMTRIAGFPPLVDAGEGFSYVYGAAGGFVLGLAVSASNR
jgi:hypothetical protein